MKILDRAAAGLALALLVAAVAPAAGSSVHLELTKSVPAKDTALAASPAEIRLWFSQATELSISRIQLTAADGTEVELGEVASAPENALVAAVLSPLDAGTYEVAWRTSSGDGHPIRGTFTFTVAAASSRRSR